MEELLAKIFSITSFVAAALTILAIVVAVVVILINGLKKAKSKDSPGGTEITEEEAKELLLKLFPLAIKIICGLTTERKETTDEK